MTHKQTKDFINSFDFPNSDSEWQNLPKGFFDIDISTFTKEEIGLYEGIKSAWLMHQREILLEDIYRGIFPYKKYINGAYFFGQISFVLLSVTLILGNIANLILIEVYHSIL